MPYGNMRLLLILLTITLLTEAKKRRIAQKKIEREETPNTDDEGRYVPVPFGHIFKEGFQPLSHQPIDLLELSRKYPVDLDEQREKVSKSLKKPDPKGFASPKDAFYFGELLSDGPEIEKNVYKTRKNKKHKLQKESEVVVGENKAREEDKKPWLDLAASHARNLAMTRNRNPGPAPRFHQDKKPSAAPKHHTKDRYFSQTSFGIQQNKKEKDTMNWTTCDEFGRNADFHPKDVINNNWVPFYSWSSKDIHRPLAFIHQFSYPTVKMVQKYKEELGPYLNNAVNWDEPKLYLKAEVDMLLVAADRRGLFIGIPYNEMPSSLKNSQIAVPTVKLRLKIVDPYLALMFCDVQYATIMAVSGNEPTTINDVRSEAAILKFKGRGYPVARDVEAERMRAKFERESKIEKEKDMYIEPEDMVGAKFPFE